jgi:hypothetical protein
MKLQLVDYQNGNRKLQGGSSCRWRRSAVSILPVMLSLLAFGSAGPAWADDDQRANPEVYGKTLGNWGHAWWRWALKFPTATNPIAQDGNVDCSAGQEGKVWFLAGTFGGPAERTCTIKKGKAIFFPLLNGIFWTPLDPKVPEDCTDEKSC